MDMKTYGIHKKLRTLTIVATVVWGMGVGLSSCISAKDPYAQKEENGGRTGTLSVASLDREGDFIVADAAGGTKGDGGTKVPDISTFRVAVLDYKGQSVVKNNLTGQEYRWKTFAEVEGEMVTMPSGKYKLEAASLAVEPLAEWETPYYYGVKDFTVRISELTTVDLVCRLANVKVTVEYDKEFLEKVDNPSAAVYFDYTDPATAQLRYAELPFPVGETRAGYFKVPDDGKLYVKVTGIRKEDGKPLGDGEGQVYIH